MKVESRKSKAAGGNDSPIVPSSAEGGSIVNPETAYVALGANLGNRREQLARAVRALDGHPQIRVTAASSLYETAPVGCPPGQPDYLNAAAALLTTLTPEELLRFTQQVERDLGRERPTHAPRTSAVSPPPAYLPRTIDIDILTHGRHCITTPDLIIPHPRMHTRAFVLRPLTDIAPLLDHPTLHRPIRDLLASCAAAGIIVVHDSTWYRPPATPSPNAMTTTPIPTARP